MKPSEGKEWMQFLENRVGGLLPCINDGMFPNNAMANKTLLQFLCPVGTVVLIRTEDEETRFAEILVCLGTRIKATFLNSRNEKGVWIDIDSIVTSPSVLKTAISKNVLKSDQEKKVYDVKSFAKYKSELHMKMYELVKVGCWLEVQAKKSPTYVYYAKVLENHGGLLKVGGVIRGANHYIHMFDPMCHHVGWALEQDSEVREDDQDVMYSEFCKQVDYSEVQANTVPEVVFKNNKVKRHNLKVGSMLAVASGDFTEFYYAHVKHILTSHFFTVAVGDGNHIDIKHGPLHIESHYIYPCNFLENIGVQLKQAILSKKSVESWEDYRNVYGKGNTENFKEVENCGLIMRYENDEVMSEIGSNICTMRYIEMIHSDDQVGVLVFAAEILRNENSMVWIRPHFIDKLLILHFSDSRLLPCGFANKFDLPIYFESERKIAIDPDVTNITHDVTGISNGKDIFMPYHVDEKHFVPRLYVHPKCEIGPFLDRNMVKSLPAICERGSQKDVLREIYKFIMLSAKPHKKNQVHQIFQKSLEEDKPQCITPLIITKYRRNVGHESQTLRAATCDNSEKMPTFMQALFRTIEACPHLISFEDTPCPYDCRKEKREIYEKKRTFEQKVNEQKNRAAKRKMILKMLAEKQKLARAECQPSTSGTQVLVNATVEEKQEEMNKDSGKGKSTESIDDIFGGHSRSLLKKMEDAANEKLLLTPLPPKIVKTTPPVFKKARPSFPPMTSKQHRTSHSVMMPNPMIYTPHPHGLMPPPHMSPQMYQQQMAAMMKASSSSSSPQQQQQAAFNQAMQMHHNTQMRNMSLPTPMPQIPPQMIMMMQQQFYSQQQQQYAQQMVQQQQQQQQHQKQQQQQQAKNRSPSTSGIFPMPSTSSGSGNGASGSGSSSGSGSKTDTIVLAGPTKEIVAEWSDEQLSDYLRNNMLNLGSESIRILKDNRISGKILLSLDKEQCNALMGTNGQGETLMRFIQWVSEKKTK